MFETAIADPETEPRHQYPNPTRPQSDLRSKFKVPLDPLLASGAYIDATNDIDGSGGADTAVDWSQDDQLESPSVRIAENGITAFAATTSENIAGPSPQPLPRVMEEVAERPSWLPADWRVEMRTRSTGASAGQTDKYYVAPVSGQKLRSKKDVMHFIETGIRRKRKSITGADSLQLETPGRQKEKSGGSKAKSSKSFSFDFMHPPETVTWVLSDDSSDNWWPQTGEGRVPISRKREWDIVFARLTQPGGPLAE